MGLGGYGCNQADCVCPFRCNTDATALTDHVCIGEQAGDAHDFVGLRRDARPVLQQLLNRLVHVPALLLQ